MNYFPELGRMAEILLIEDNPGDIVLASEALRVSRIINNLHIVRDGVEALAFLKRRGKYADASRPDIVLLDLNLPKMDGHSVLDEIKSDPDLKMIPVVILTSSEAEQDILKSYGLHANAYITKPVELERFINVVRSLGDFWLTIVKLPSGALSEAQEGA